MTFEPLTPDRRRRQTREHLLEAAAQVLAERGFHGASLDEVAAVAGFTKGAVYSNFKNKEDLFLALLETLHEREMAALQETLESSDVPPESRLGDFVAFINEPPVKVPYSGTALYLEFCLYAMRNPAARSSLVALEEAMIDSVASMIEAGRNRRGIDSGEPVKHLARIVEAFTRGISLMRVLDPDAIDEPFLESAIEFIARGLAPSETVTETTGTPPPQTEEGSPPA
jgi:AcrR family transcriptional regulator